MSRYLGTRGRASLAVAICDRCRLKCRYTELSADGNSPGLRVCRKCHDPIDRWRLPPRQTETISLQHPRPEEPLSAGDPSASDPIASFTPTSASGTFPLVVCFTNTSTGASSWAWDFNGDGTVDSVSHSPCYTFLSAGTFTVSLKVTNASGLSSSASTTITVSAPITSPTYIYLDFDTTLTRARVSGGSDASISFPTGVVTVAGASQDTLAPPPPLDPGQAINPLFPGSVYAARGAVGVPWSITLGGAFDNVFQRCTFDFVCNAAASVQVEFFDSFGTSIGSFSISTGTGTNFLWTYDNTVNCFGGIHQMIISGSASAWPALDNVRFYST